MLLKLLSLATHASVFFMEENRRFWKFNRRGFGIGSRIKRLLENTGDTQMSNPTSEPARTKPSTIMSGSFMFHMSRGVCWNGRGWDPHLLVEEACYSVNTMMTCGLVPRQ